MKRSLLNRFQKHFVLPLIVFLACFVIGLSWWTIQLQLGITESDLDRTGIISVENLAKSSLSAVLHMDRESLLNLVNLLREKDPDIASVAFLNPKGTAFFTDGETVNLPLDPDRLKFMKSTEIHKIKYYHLFLSPVLSKAGRVNAIAVLILSKNNLNQMHRRGMIIFTVIALAVIGFNILIYQYLVREAMRASELEKAYQNLQKLQDQILQAEKMAAIGRLASGVGHELRNPLGAIKNAVYYIRDSIPASNLLDIDPTVAEFIDVIETEVKTSTTIIADLLDYSKVGKLHPQMTDLNGLLLEAKSVLEIPQAIRIHESLAKGLPPIMADPVRLRQVFINLLTNAVQAMPQGGHLTLQSSVENHGHAPEIWLSFKDTGVGIRPENRKKIFEPLFTTKDKGTGLGLAIVLGIVEAHGGKVDLESAIGKGAEFIVKLPLVDKVTN